MDASSSSGDDNDWEIISIPSRPRSPAPSPKPPRGKTAESEPPPLVAAAAAAAAAAEVIATKVQAPIPAAAPATPLVLLSTNMPGWKDEYISSILEAEKSSPVNHELVEACSLLNDRIASLEAEKAQWQLSIPTSSNNTQPATTAKKTPATSSAATNAAAADPTAQSRLRTDLAEALRQKSSLEGRLRKATSERDALQATQRAQSRAVRELTGERDALRLRVGDQAEELRGKKQMLEQVQDEVLALELQLNVAEQQKAKIAAENKQLIERWMRRARQEADDMNAANEKRGDGP